MESNTLEQIERERDDYSKTVIEQAAVIEELRRRVDELTDRLVAQAKLPVPEDLLEMDIFGMGLYSRSYNCFCRAGYKKIRDIYDIPTIKELHIRSFGEKSILEVLSAMRRLGFSEWYDKMINYRCAVNGKAYKHLK